MQKDRRPAPSISPTTQAGSPRPILSAKTLSAALTPRGLFTNLFVFHFASTSVGSVKQSTKVKKEDVADRKRPSFYQADDVLYAYGSGLEEFRDDRFTPAIVSVDTRPDFTRFIIKIALAEFFRSRGYLVRFRRVGISIIDHHDRIASASSGYLHLYPEFTLQPHTVEGAEGNQIFCVSMEPAWVTVPSFEIGPRLERHPELLHNLKVTLNCSECNPDCPLFQEQDSIVGVFEEFLPTGTDLSSGCSCAEYTPQPVQVHQRKRRKGKVHERRLVLPGQVLQPASGQRRVLRLFKDRAMLEREGRIWLGDLTRTGRARSGALQVRYERVQRFLTTVAGDETGSVQFLLPTGPLVSLDRLPLSVEELAYA